MPTWKKIVVTTWTTLLAAPIFVGSLSYATLTCTELEPCSTGKPLPGAPIAVAVLAVVTLLQMIFLLWIWKPEASRASDR